MSVLKLCVVRLSHLVTVDMQHKSSTDGGASLRTYHHGSSATRL
jgi:hypothetical protein